MTAECTFCNDTKQEPGQEGPCMWCTGSIDPASAPIKITRDDVAGTVTIEGITYAAVMFRQLGGLMPLGRLFRLTSRSTGPHSGTICIEQLEQDTQAQRFTIAHLRYAGGEEHNVKYVSEVDYDRVVAERDAINTRLTAADEHNDRLIAAINKVRETVCLPASIEAILISALDRKEKN